MRVRNWMSPGIVLLTSDTSILEALRFMNSKGISRIGVIHAGHIAGVLSRDELYGQLESPGSTLISRKTIRDLCPTIPVFVTLDDTLDRAAQLFTESNAAALPVLDGPTAAGVITPWDVCRAFRQVFGLRPHDAPATVVLLNVPRESDLLEQIGRRTHHESIQSLLAYPASVREWQVMIRLTAGHAISRAEAPLPVNARLRGESVP